MALLSDQIVAREPLGSAGASGNTLERVTLRDGRELIHKEVSPKWDWISRATGDDGRVVKMCARGLFDRFPATIDHATVAAEHAGDRWVLSGEVCVVVVSDRGSCVAAPA